MLLSPERKQLDPTATGDCVGGREGRGEEDNAIANVAVDTEDCKGW